MTYVTEFAIEETIFHTIDGVETETNRAIIGRQFDNRAAAEMLSLIHI